jgi:enoyl-CoA hydratase/carnithine racemase
MRPAYFDRYPTIHFERDADGILLMRFHSNNGPVVYSGQHHSDWCSAFYEVGADRGNNVIIMTGTGDEFISQFGWDKDLSTAADFDETYWEGKNMLRNLLNIEVPIIAAVNGPATIHAEMALLSDITLASNTAIFQDMPHMTFSVVPGDGVHIVWLDLLGSNRGRYFLLTGQILSAEEALSLGVINEILAPDQLLPRAYEHARKLASLSLLTRRYSRVAMTHRLKRLIEENLGYGLALEGLAAMDLIKARKP